MSNQIDYRHWRSEINKSNSKYKQLFVKGRAYPPIFFFGDPEGAVMATVGINPSAGEFSKHRKWGPEYGELNRLLERCRNYFDKPAGIPPHPWFWAWENFLDEIGVSYQTSPRAVHLDFSPRATRSTRSMQKESEQLLFLALMKNDLKYFIGQLRAYPSIKYLYAAGTVTKRYWAIDVLENSQHLSYKIKQRVVPFKSPGQEKPYVGLYKLDIGGVLRYLFFCSTSPSARNPDKLVQKAQWLIKHYPEFLPSHRR